MPFLKDLPIRVKIILLIVLVSTINIILAAFAQFYYEKKLYNNELIQKLRILTDVIGESNSATIIFNDQKTGTNYLSALKADKHVEHAVILLPDSSLFAQYINTQRALISEYIIPLKADTSIFSGNVLIVSRPIKFEGEAIGTIRVEYSLSEYKKKENQYYIVMTVIIALSIVTATFLAYFFQSGITSPIFSLYNVMNSISFKKDYSIRSEINTDDEIGKLSDGFNFMIQQIEQQNNELKNAKAQSDSALKAKERFLANMTHELRTPLNSIVGIANLIEDTKLNQEQKDFIKNIKISSDHLLTIINDLLEFSKLGSGKLQLEKSEFSIRRTVDRIEKTMEYELTNRNLAFFSSMDKAIPHFVVGDEYRLNQILINLVGNAIKFTPLGNIKIVAEKFSEDSENIVIKFKVIDTGIGIAKEKQKIIFESFTQESTETNRLYGGTGLGLAITKQLVEIQNGQISVESEKDKGSSFIFTIPYNKKAVSAKKRKIGAGVIKNKKVLLVDDNSMNLLFTKSLLDKNGLITATSDNGKEALELFEKEDFDIILLDLHMPIMDGYELCRNIRLISNPAKRQVPIIALTAAATLSEIKKCFDSGMNDYLVKPFDKEDLFSKILSLLLNNPDNND